MKRNRNPIPPRSALAVIVLASAMVMSGCATLEGALWGAYLGAESGDVAGLVGGAVVGAGVGLVVDVAHVIDGDYDPYETEDIVSEYYYPCSCDACQGE